jgi:hypothetical protein
LTALDAALATWSFLWDRRPAIPCPSCGRIDQVLIHMTTGLVLCPECK